MLKGKVVLVAGGHVTQADELMTLVAEGLSMLEDDEGRISSLMEDLDILVVPKGARPSCDGAYFTKVNN